MHFSPIIQFYGSVFVKIPIWFSERLQQQYCLLAMLEKWKSGGALLTDLSKAFDCLSYKLLLEKLHAYRFSIAALRQIHTY